MSKSLVTITDNESKALRLLPDKLKLGDSSMIRDKFIYLLDNVDALLSENK